MCRDTIRRGGATNGSRSSGSPTTTPSPRTHPPPVVCVVSLDRLPQHLVGQINVDLPYCWIASNLSLMPCNSYRKLVQW